jgi:nucleoporin NUP82
MADLAEHDLVIAETITLVESDQSSFNQSITSDIHTDFTFFVSHASGVFYVSLEPWIRKLENELSQPQAQGAEFRMERLLESANSTIEKHLPRKTSSSFAEEEVTSAAILEDGNIGYMLLTSVDGEPQAVFLDAPEYGQPTELDFSKWMNFNVPPTEVRLAWQPPKAFYEPVDLLSSINVPTRHKADMKEEVRLSQSTLELLINIHRVLSAKTSHLQLAVADLFNRATRLQEEFKDQVWRTSQVTSKIDAVTGNDEKESGDGSAHGAAKIDERLDKVRSRQAQMNARYEALRRKMDRVNPSDLSEKEAGFVEELSTMDSAVDSSNTTLTGDIDGSQVPAWQRMDKLKKTQKELAKQVERTRDDATSKETSARSSNMAVPSHSRKAENEHIQEMLARNAALVEAATQRLRTLGVAIPLDGES